jgi:hypothetical protein
MAAFSVLLIVLFGAICLCAAQSGWKMTDRFLGFRYELALPAGAIGEEDFVGMIKTFADENKCFGWVQVPRKNTFVGEVRCLKEKGKLFKQWMEGQGDTAGALLDMFIYPDTKIRLHFTYFKVLDPARDTCFLDAPHRCASAVSSSTSSSTSSSSGSLPGEGDEL